MIRGMATTPAQERFIHWLLQPKSEREPPLQQDLARELGLARETLTHWKSDTDFLEAWNARYLRTIGSPDSKMKIMNTLLQTATDPDDPKHVQAGKAFFEIEGSLRPAKTAVDVRVSGMAPSELTDEQLEQMLADKANDELAKRREAS